MVGDKELRESLPVPNLHLLGEKEEWTKEEVLQFARFFSGERTDSTIRKFAMNVARLLSEADE